MTHAIGSERALTNTSIDSTDKNANAARRDIASAISKNSSVDATTLSGAANLLSTAGSGGTGDDVRTDKVAALKSAIDSGTYNVPASAVADKLIQNLLG